MVLNAVFISFCARQWVTDSNAKYAEKESI